MNLGNRFLELTRGMHRNPGATIEEVDEALRHIPGRAPGDYREFLLFADGAEGAVGGSGYLAVWRASELEPLNKEYAVEEFAPGFWIFGSDGGDTAYAFDLRGNGTAIVSLPFIGMSEDEAAPLGNTFVEFLERLKSEA